MQMALIDPPTIVVTSVLGIPNHIVLAIRMEETVTIMSVVNIDIVVHPIVIIVIHMIDQQAVARTA